MRAVHVLVAALVVACTPVDASAKWTRVRSQHFLVIGEASEGRIRRTAQKLEQFRDMVARVLPGAVAVSPAPVLVVVFPHAWAFTPYVPPGRSSDLVGYSVSWEDVSYIALNAGRADIAESIAFHEFTHILMGNTFGEIPLWLNEGLAELYATFQDERGGRGAMIGAGRGYHLSVLRSRGLIPIADLIAIDDKSPEYDEGVRRGILYAQSWALMHYLSFGSPERRSQLTAYLAGLQAGQPSIRAFVDAFGPDFSALDSELRDYIRRVSVPVVRVEFSERVAIDTSLRGEAMADLEGNAYLGELLFRLEQPDAARRHLQRILDKDPAQPRAVAAMGLIELETGRIEQAIALLRRAADLAPEEGAIRGTLGRALVLRAQQLPAGGEASAAALDDARSTLEQATKLEPTAAHAFALLGYVALLGRSEPAAAVAHLSRAVQMAPAREQYRMRLAEALLRDRQFERARSYLAPLATRARSPQVRNAAATLLATIVQRQLDVAK
jgi:tetratricopeptide (TPR) repeat protein